MATEKAYMCGVAFQDLAQKAALEADVERKAAEAAEEAQRREVERKIAEDAACLEAEKQLRPHPTPHLSCSAMTVEIQFHTMGDSFTIHVESTGTLADVKWAVEKLRHVPFVEQKLILGYEVLGDEVFVANLERDHGDIIVLLFVREDMEVVKWIDKAARDWMVLCSNASGSIEKGDKAPEWVWSDRRIIMAAMRQNPEVLKHAVPHVQADQEVVLLGIRLDWDCLRYAAEELRADRRFILAAIQEDPHSLEHASEEVRDDRAVVRAAMRRDYQAYKYASEACKKDTGFLLAALKKDRRVLALVDKSLLQNSAFMIAAARTNWQIIMLSQETLGNEAFQDRDVFLAALSQDWQAFKYAPTVHLFDPEIVMAAAKMDPRAIAEVGTRVSSFDVRAFNKATVFDDHAFVLSLIEQVPSCFAYLPGHIQGVRDFAVRAIEHDGCALKWTQCDLQNDRTLVMAAVKRNWRALEFASHDLKADREIVRAAAKQSSSALRYAARELQDRKKLMSDESACADCGGVTVHSELIEEPMKFNPIWD